MKSFLSLAPVILLCLVAHGLCLTRGERAYRLARDGRFDDALRQYEKAMTEARARDDIPAQARYFANMAQILLDKRNLEESSNLAQAALALYSRMADREGQGICHQIIARRLRMEAKYELALMAVDSALDLFTAAKKKAALAPAQNEKGLIFLNAGQLDSSAACFGKALKFNRKKKNFQGCASNLNNLGKVFMSRADWSAARLVLEEAVSMDEKSGNRSGKSVPLVHLSLVAAKQGRCNDAAFFLGRAQALGMPPSLQPEVDQVLQICPPDRANHEARLEPFEPPTQAHSQFGSVLN